MSDFIREVRADYDSCLEDELTLIVSIIALIVAFAQ